MNVLIEEEARQIIVLEYEAFSLLFDRHEEYCVWPDYQILTGRTASGILTLGARKTDAPAIVRPSDFPWDPEVRKPIDEE